MGSVGTYWYMLVHMIRVSNSYHVLFKNLGTQLFYYLLIYDNSYPISAKKVAIYCKIAQLFFFK